MEQKHKHTPGPWIWKSVPQQAAGSQVHFTTLVGTPTKEKGFNFDEMICDVMPTDAQGKQELGENFLQSLKRKQEANARLIAAAPELLAVARCALADLQGVMPEYEVSGNRQHPGWQTIKELKSAIAKAESSS